jgi:hypothetical protein
MFILFPSYLWLYAVLLLPDHTPLCHLPWVPSSQWASIICAIVCSPRPRCAKARAVAVGAIMSGSIVLTPYVGSIMLATVVLTGNFVIALVLCGGLSLLGSVLVSTLTRHPMGEGFKPNVALAQRTATA